MSKGFMRRSWIALAVLSVAVVATSVPAAAHMSVDGEIYSRNGDGTYTSMDPVNVIFTSFNGGYGATRANTRAEIMDHAGWGDAIIGSDMYFLDHGRFLINDGQLASPCCGIERWHVRIRQGWDRDTSGWVGTYTNASVHHDGFVWCQSMGQHIGEDFDQARNYLTDLVGRAPGHAFSAPGINFWDRGRVVNCDGPVHQPDVATNFVWV